MTASSSPAWPAQFWRALGRARSTRAWPPARHRSLTAIVALSAHTLARRAVTLAAARHEAVHDFGGFPGRRSTTCATRWPACRAPRALHVEQLLQWAGASRCEHAEAGGLRPRHLGAAAQHPSGGRHSRVAGGLPARARSPAQLFELGARARQLAGRRRRVDHRHRLHHAQPAPGPAARGAGARDRRQRRVPRPGLPSASAARDWDALWHYRALAPEAQFMHPTDEHLLPWFIAAGAGGQDHAPRSACARERRGRATLGMDAYAVRRRRAPALARAVEVLRAGRLA